jgi:molybdate transport system substrate-binding protein
VAPGHFYEAFKNTYKGEDMKNLGNTGVRKAMSHAAAIGLSAVACGVLGFVMLSSAAAAELRLYAGAGLKQPLDLVVDNFQKKTGHRIIVDYDGSGRLLTKLELTGQGDLFIPGEGFYIDKLHPGAVHSRRTIVLRAPVIAVSKKHPGNITSLADLARPGVRVGLGDPQAMALGKTADMILERSGLKANVLKNTVVFAATVKQLALYASEGTVDAAIVGRPDALQFSDTVRSIPIPREFYEPDMISVAVLTSTVDLQAACALRDFLVEPSSREVFMRFGFNEAPPSVPAAQQ